MLSSGRYGAVYLEPHRDSDARLSPQVFEVSASTAAGTHGCAILFVPGLGPLLVMDHWPRCCSGRRKVLNRRGRVLGALAGWSISKLYILKYEDHVKGGKYLVIAHGNAEEVARAQTILQSSTATELNHHVEANLDPMTTIAAERSLVG